MYEYKQLTINNVINITNAYKHLTLTLPEKTSSPGRVPFSRVSLVPPSVVYLQNANNLA